MAKQLTKEDRGRVAEKIMEWGNLVFIGLTLGQFISPPPLKVPLALAGILLMIVAYIAAIVIMKGDGRP